MSDSAHLVEAAYAAARGEAPTEIAPQVPRVRFDAASLMSRPSVPVDWALPNLAPAGQLTTLYGSVGSGKTSIIEEYMRANGQERQPFGYLEMSEQKVVLFDWEDGADLVKTTLERLGVKPNQGGFEVVFPGEDPDLELVLDTPEGREAIRELLADAGATVAVFNSRDAAFPHTPELDGDLVKPAMRAAKDLARQTGVAIVLISHEPKADYQDGLDKLTGHAGWSQYCDQAFRLRKHGDARILEHTKNRGVGKRGSLKIRLEIDGDPDTGALRLLAEAHDGKAERAAKVDEDVALVEGYLDAHGDKAWGELKAGTELSDARLRTATKASGRVWQAGERKPYSTKPRMEALI